MSWWLTTRRVYVVLLPGLFGTLALLVLFRDTVIELPSFLSGSANPVLLVLMAPVPLCAALLLTLDSRLVENEDTAIRPVARWDTLLVLVPVALVAGLAFWFGQVAGVPAAMSGGRNVAFLVGLMLVFHALIGSAAVMAPVVWIFIVLFFGLASGGQGEFWTVLPRPLGDVPSAGAAVIALTAGLVMHLRKNSPGWLSRFGSKKWGGDVA